MMEYSNFMDEDPDKLEFYKQYQTDLQNDIVNVRTSSTSTSEALIWTYRTTSCDVISIITTAVPIKNGQMSDIKLEYKEKLRIKASKQNGLRGRNFDDSPFESGVHINKEKVRNKLNSILLEEKNDFMAKLSLSRFIRTKVEYRSATLIQALYRGHFTRNNFKSLKKNLLINKQIRSNVKSFLGSKYGLIVSMSDYKRCRMKLRNRSAQKIQSHFISYISKKCLNRRRNEKKLLIRLKAAIKIQTLLRKYFATKRIDYLKEHVIKTKKVLATIKIQRRFRKLLSTRKVQKRRFRFRWIASRMIQFWYKHKLMKKKAEEYKLQRYMKRANYGALLMQKLIRKFIAYRRVLRIRLRKLYYLVYRYSVRIQSMIRRFLSQIKVQKIQSLQNSNKGRTDAKFQLTLRKSSKKILSETQNLLDEANIFLQASLGNTEGVGDIFEGLVSLDEHKVTDTDEHGDTVLTIAATNGNVDLLRKCIQWGFDLNHRNVENKTALMLSIENGHYAVMQYILSHKSIEDPVGDDEDDPEMLDALLLNPYEPWKPNDTGSILVPAAKQKDINILLSLLSIVEEYKSLNYDIDAKNMELDSCTALLAACKVGHIEHVKLLLKYNANPKLTDINKQNVLHKASLSSLEIVCLLLGVQFLPNEGKLGTTNQDISDESRVNQIEQCDCNGKNCLLLAALAGQNDILSCYEAILLRFSTKEKSLGRSTDSVKDSQKSIKAKESDSISEKAISWTPQDINFAYKLVADENLLSLHKILEVGFDPNWFNEETGSTLAMIACYYGNCDVIDILLSKSADFSLPDRSGKNVFHYAAGYMSMELRAPVTQENMNSAVFPHLISHQHAKQGKITPDLLLVQDQYGDTPLHVAAKYGVVISIDLLARKEIEKALTTRNLYGMTPLMSACKYRQYKVIQYYRGIGGIPLSLDSENHDSLWHLFHSVSTIKLESSEAVDDLSSQVSTSTKKQPKQSLLYFIGNEFHRYQPNGVNSSVTTDDNNAAELPNQIKIVIDFLKNGCKLYKNRVVTPQVLLEIVPPPQFIVDFENVFAIGGKDESDGMSVNSVSSILRRKTINPDTELNEIGDAIVCCAGVTLLNMIPKTEIPILDCWRLVIASIVFDPTPNFQCFLSLLHGGAIEVLRGEVLSNGNNMNDEDWLQKLKGKPFEYELTNEHVERLSDVFYSGMNIVGWIIRLGNSKMLELFLEKGYDPTVLIDGKANATLHYIAQFGTPDMVDIVMKYQVEKKFKNLLQLEQTNAQGQTAGMLVAIEGNVKTGLKLFKYKVDVKKSLEGRYASWILARVKRLEKMIKTTQTGRIGDDDERSRYDFD